MSRADSPPSDTSADASAPTAEGSRSRTHASGADGSGGSEARTDNPARLSRDDWRVILTRTVHEYRINQVQDIAAALTYYAVLATFPALLATLAALGIFGSAEAVTEDVLRVIEDLGGSTVIDPLREAIAQLLDASHAGTRVHHRARRRALGDLGLRRRLRPRHEPHLRGGGGASVLAHAARDARHLGGAPGPRHDRRVRDRAHGSDRRVRGARARTRRGRRVLVGPRQAAAARRRSRSS